MTIRSAPIFIFITLFIACQWLGKANKTEPTPGLDTKPIKQMPITALPLTGDYSEDWKIVDSLEKKGLYKSALEKVENIQEKAKNDKNSQQLVKALIFRGKFMTMLEEDGMVKAIQVIEQETKAAAQPEKSVLQSMLGQLYTTYLSSQRWKILERTEIPDGEGGDILTWSAAQIEKQALEYYSASVSLKAVLRGTPVDDFKDVTTKSLLDKVDDKPLRSTLYDLLAHRALAHFINERSYLTEPVYAFQLNQPEAFADNTTFVEAKFESKDSTSGKWLAVKILQQITEAQMPSKRGPGGPALVDVDLARLQFALHNSILENKDSLYQQALERMAAEHQSDGSYGEIIFKLANHIFNHKGDVPEQAKSVVAMLEKAIKEHPDTYGASQCALLLNQIKATMLELRVEQVNLPDKPMLLQLSFKNLNKVWVKVVKGDFELDKFDGLNETEKSRQYLQQKAIQSKVWEIQDPVDYQNHNTEISLDKLPPGSYWLFVSDHESMDPESGILVFENIQVSRLTAVNYNQQGETTFILADRESGAPLPGVKVDFYQYNYNSRKRKIEHVGSVKSSRDGLVENIGSVNNQVLLRASDGKDTLWIGEAYKGRPGRYPVQKPTVQFFTDRAIYRPGQRIYFKGLAYQPVIDGDKSHKVPEIVAGQTLKVTFYDANSQAREELKLKSNEYGTFNGSFVAPANGLTGVMSIQASDGVYGSTSVRVEEYKRPRFEVAMEPIEGAFRLNDKVVLKGGAKNFAGNAVDGAEVKYHIQRVARFPYWDYYRSSRRPAYFNQPYMEIAHGDVLTDAEGNFTIEFTAIPDVSIPKNSQPVFDYMVTVDVTDITGETYSTNTRVRVGYVALEVSWTLPNEVFIDSLKHVKLYTSNLAGQKQAAEGTISLQQLREPEQFYKRRYWEGPDIATISKSDFNRMFPDMAWKDEDDPTTWKKSDKIWSIPFNTANAEMVDMHTGQVKPGYYIAKLSTKDAYGEPIEIERIVRVWDKGSRFVTPGAATDTPICEPGETARIEFGGKPGDLYFFFAQEKEGVLQKPEWISSRMKDLSSIDINVLESDRGGINTHWFAIKNNRIYGPNRIGIHVPWSNKDLNISYETFRDKLAPGQQEQWILKISGPKKEKVAAEMVASLYDASLDQFVEHYWNKLPFPSNYSRISINYAENFALAYGRHYYRKDLYEGIQNRMYKELNWFNFPFWGNRIGERLSMMRSAPPGSEVDYDNAMKLSYDTYDPEADGAATMEVSGIVAEDSMTDSAIQSESKKPEQAPPAGIRRNLDETVFFFPELRTDSEGNVLLKFTMNEALTRWKLLTYAHTKDLQQAVSVNEVITQKELMVIPNPPRFLRQGDEMEFSAKVSNLSKNQITGSATLNMLDAATMIPMEREFGLATNKRAARFSVLPGQSAFVSWRIKVPDEFYGAVTWQVFAEGNGFRDGEESSIPVVSNRMLVTESIPMSLRGNQSKTFVFENFRSSKENGSLQTKSYTLEFSSNPVWYAVQALPYLMEFPYECSEQIFNRMYANALAGSVVEKMPQIKRVFDRWSSAGNGSNPALMSNLSKNQELKYALLEETPWVLDAKDEETQKRNIALLFDLNKMADEQERAINTLAERQLGNGGWPWFPGGQDNWYITQYIATGMMHLQKLGAFDVKKIRKAANMQEKALRYCDDQFEEHYQKLMKLVASGKAKKEDDHLDGMIIQYLYMRSFAPVDRPTEAIGYYLDQATKYWLKKGIYEQGMLSLILQRFGNKNAAVDIVNSLRERALVKEELGMYWPVSWGFYWYQMPIETQALMVEVFGEVANDNKSVEELRIWLLKNKQTNRWESTKATAEAVYSLLLFGDNWLNNTQAVQISAGGKALKIEEYEAGTGYFKQSWVGESVPKSLAEIKVDNPNSNIVWGAAYWQYFEDLDQIKDFQQTPLTIKKELFLEENSDRGKVLKPIVDGQALKRGDKVKVRIEIRVDRPMEFVHLKDMRAAGFEPVNVLSGYRWQGGLGYYESTRDLATHFFIDYLPRGTYVFEYPLVVSLRGDMSNGITTMQCMYAPEFNSHSKGIRVKVE
ncbi:MAG: alpha-2-macroglobulin family protein [Saprospiraceae bacterium]